MQEVKPTVPEDIQPQQGAGVEGLIKQAVKLLYDDQLKNVTKMLGNATPEQLPESLALVITETLKKLEKDNGGLSLEVAAQVGMQLLQYIIEDFVTDGIIKEVNSNQVKLAMAAAVKRYGKSKGIPNEEIEALVKEMAKLEQQAMPQQQPQQGMMQQPQQGAAQQQQPQGLLQQGVA